MMLHLNFKTRLIFQIMVFKPVLGFEEGVSIGISIQFGGLRFGFQARVWVSSSGFKSNTLLGTPAPSNKSQHIVATPGDASHMR